MQLNLGCGEDFREGFVNIDNRDLEPPPGIKFLQADILQYLQSLESGSVQYVHLQDIIEHFVKDDAIQILREIFRVLDTNGDICVRAPDGYWIAKRLIDPEEGEEVEAELYSWLLMGGQTYEGNFHYTIWTPDWMQSTLIDIGYSMDSLICGTTDDNNFTILARRPS